MYAVGKGIGHKSGIYTHIHTHIYPPPPPPLGISWVTVTGWLSYSMAIVT